MQFGIEVVPFGPYSDPRLVVELAQAAEQPAGKRSRSGITCSFPTARAIRG
jgi:hypothetical protein